MPAMGFETMKGPAFREYLRVVRALLHGEEVEYVLDGSCGLANRQLHVGDLPIANRWFRDFVGAISRSRYL